MDIFIYISVFAIAILALVALRICFMGFGGQDPSDYEGLGPDFDLREFFQGNLVCDGVIFGPTGRVTSRFHADMVGEWTGRSGVLHEDFHYDSGTRQRRAWHLDLGDGDRFEARADDVHGIASGHVSGPTVRLKYRIVLPKEAGGHKLDVVDWMYLSDSRTVVNRSQFRKFGLLAAELVATIRREDAS